VDVVAREIKTESAPRRQPVRRAPARGRAPRVPGQVFTSAHTEQLTGPSTQTQTVSPPIVRVAVPDPPHAGLIDVQRWDTRVTENEPVGDRDLGGVPHRGGHVAAEVHLLERVRPNLLVGNGGPASLEGDSLLFQSGQLEHARLRLLIAGEEITEP